MTWGQCGQDINGEGVSDNSGRSVSLSSSGNTLAIGALLNDGAGRDAGHARIYDWDTVTIPNQWTKRGLDIDGEAAGDYSGISVSLSSDGNIVAIGALYNDGAGSNAGHVRVYYWDTVSTPNKWTQRGQDINGEAVNDNSGWSVSLSSDGNTVAVGGPYNDGSITNAGHVRIYDWNTVSWTQRGSDIDGEGINDNSGVSVSLSSDGNTVAIGARYNDGSASNAGHARVYDWDTVSTPNKWTQRGQDINGEAESDNSGWSVSLSSNGDTVAVGAINNDGNGSNAGHVRVYDWDTTVTPNRWTQRGQDINGEAVNDNSGFSVSLSSDGNTVAVGGPYNDGTGVDAGHVRVYDWNTVSWTQRGSDIDGEATEDYSGWSVSLSSNGNILAVGATLNDGSASNAGHARVYKYE
jgi:phage tail sheath gpL-like